MLFFFYVILVIVRRFNLYKVLLVLIIIFIGVGFLDNIDSYLSILRIIVFFLIFYLGYIFIKKYMVIFKNKKLILVFIIIFILFFIVYVIYFINVDWLLGSLLYILFENEG